MKVSLPVFHALEARYKRHRNSQSMSVYSYHDFEIEEVSERDAPIVAKGFDRNNSPIKKDYSSKRKPVENPTGILRYYDDSFWYPEYNASNEPVRAEHWSAHHPKGTEKHDVEKRFWDALFNEAEEKGLACNYRDHSSIFDEDDMRDIQSSNLHETLDFYTNRISENVRVIGGVIYHRTSEPIYAVRSDYQEIYATLLFTPVPSKDSAIEYFSLDRHEEMTAQLQHFKDLFPEQFDRKTINTGSSPEIHLQGLFQFDDDKTSMLRSAAAGFHKIEGELKDMTREAVSLWFDLKEALNEYNQSPNADKADAVSQSYGRLSDKLKADIELGESDVGLKHFVASADYALTRWDMRDISLDIDISLMS